MPHLRRPSTTRSNPTETHEFVESEDSRSGLAVSAVQGDFQMVSPGAVAAATMRPARCALPGCGKPREDPIHWPDEEDTHFG